MHSFMNHYAPIDLMAPLMKKAAEDAKVPCSLHLDHGVSEKYILKAIRNGFTSIMVDLQDVHLKKILPEQKQ